MKDERWIVVGAQATGEMNNTDLECRNQLSIENDLSNLGLVQVARYESPN